MLIHFSHTRLFEILSDGELILSQSSFYTFSHKLSLCVSLSVCDTIFCSVAYFSIVTYYCCLVTKLLFVQSLSRPTLLRPYGLYPARLLSLWDFPSKNTGVVCCLLLQVIFPTQGQNLSLLHWQADSLPLRYREAPQSNIALS